MSHGLKKALRIHIHCLLVFCLAPVPAYAGEETPLNVALGEEAEREGESRLYRTRSERREAGLDREITPWLRFSGLAEFEALGETFSAEDLDENITATEESAVIQLGLVAEPLEWLAGELILEYDSEFDEVLVEEATVSADVGDWEVLIGKQYLPFGVYYSNFITGPILDIGETQENAITLTWDHEDRLEFAASVYEGVAEQQDESGNGLDYALGLNAVVHERLGIGVSYLADLGDTDGRLLEDFDNRFARKVAGLSAYAIWIGDSFESTVEVLGAQDHFNELDSDRDRPLAWNFELALFIHPRAELDFRLEGSRQLAGFPETQWGVATNIQLHRRAFLTLEVLRGDYKRGFELDDDDNALKTVTTIGVQLALAF